ncbi:MAG TPA: glycosyltransferase family 39 protein, partial [Bacillota bacterium]
VYRFSGWVATEGIPENRFGACLCVMGGFVHSQEVKGSSNWQPVELVFRTQPNQTEVVIGVRLGFYGSTSYGTAYFDDLTLEKVTDPKVIPKQLDDHSLNFQSDFTKQVTIYRPKNLKTLVTQLIGFFDYSFWTILGYLLLLMWLLGKKSHLTPVNIEKTQEFEERLSLYFLAAAVVALLIRIPLLPAVPFKIDLGNFKAWTLRIAETGPLTFYAPDYYCDYPPFSLYIFWILGKIVKLFNLSGNELIFNSILKLPSFICDTATAWLMLALTRKKNPVLGLIIALVYLFLPPVIYNSAYWGQVDTYYAFMVLAAFYLLVKKSYPELAAALVVASFLTKAQTIAFIPLFLLYLFLNFHWKRWVGTFGTVIVTLVLILLPFNLKQSFTWIIDLYRKQAELYPYASLNAANFLALLNGNSQPDTVLVLPGISFRVIGYLLFFACTFWSGYYYWRKRTWGGLLVAFMFIAFAFFMFFPRMHERYLFPVFAYLLLLFLLYKDKRLYYLTILLSITNLLNMHAVVLKYQNLLSEELFQRIIYILALVNTVIFVVTWGIFQLQLSPEKRQKKAKLRLYDTLLGENYFNKLKSVPFALQGRDYRAIAIIALFYCALVFFRLGSWSTPKTGVDLDSPQSAIEVIFDQPTNLTTVAWYDAEGTGQLRIEKYDNGAWQELGLLSCENYYVLKRQPLAATLVERLRLTPQAAAGHLKEVAFLDGERLIPIKTVKQLGQSTSVAAAKHPLFDEQQKMMELPSHLNSTYFDEIYHGRTAYEFVKQSAVYETTHPPLGKDILAVGVALFGMNPFGMRVMHALIGVGFIIALFFLGRQVLATRFGAYATMLAGFWDFMPLVQSRYSTIDTTSVLFITLMLTFTFKYLRGQLQPGGGKSPLPTIAAVIFCYALGASVKWTVHYGFAGVVVCVALLKIWQYLELKRGLIGAGESATATLAFDESVTTTADPVVPQEREMSSVPEVNPVRGLWRKEIGLTVLQWFGLFVLIAPLTYYLTYIPFLRCQRVEKVFSKTALIQVWENQKGMFNYHSQLTATHPFESNWWGWPFNFKPLWIYSASYPRPGFKGTIVSLGNPVIWYWGGMAILILLYQVLIKRKFSLLHLVLIGFFALYLPWVLVTRATFIYHFFPVLPLYYVLGVMVLEPLWEMKKPGRKIIYTLAALAVVLWLIFYPVITGLEVPERYVQALRWFPRDWVF